MRRAVTLALVLALVAGTSAAKKKKSKDDDEDKGPWQAKTFSGLKLRSIGPALMSGRIADIAIHPERQSTWYVAVGSGNLWKTTNAGTTWKPIFDDQKSYSLGCVTLDPSNPEIVWLGSGENVSGRHVGYGDGVYRSLDGGTTWTNMGLGASEHIGNIVVDPRDSKVVYVAAQGPLWSKGGDRGLFKTGDGGATWTKLLGDDDYTGVNEVRMDPRDPDVLYAATHQHVRTVAALLNGGPESGIHKSTDAGATWRRLKKGLPEEDMGKIGLAISSQRPDVVYATIELGWRKGGFWRSSDAGETWDKRNDYVSGATGPHYYQEIFASPHAFDRVYQMDARMHWSEDGGKKFRRVGEKHKHGDNHALAFDPNDPEYLLAGSDGGLYESWDLGKNWKYVANLPVTQFYKVAIDYDEPFYNVIGGTQDNNTQYGPSRTDSVQGIRNSDWSVTLWGDGHQPAIDPSNPDVIYSEWQQGNLVRVDRPTGEFSYIQPQPARGENVDRFNWDSPILISPHDPKRLYFASQRVWRSDDRGDSWRALSGDLSHGRDRLTLPMMDRVWSIDAVWDLYAMSKYGTVTSLSESPLVDGLLYAGTDDGRVQVSEDGGGEWRAIDELKGVPDGFFVNDIKADLHDADTVYVAVDDHKSGDFSPYLLKSTDRGASWKSIAKGLPERHIVWRVVQDHVSPGLLFAGTELGLFFTIDGGERWVELSGDVPTIAFRDLVIQKRENDLVGATFGRGFYILDDYSPLRQASDEMLAAEATLFPVRRAWWYLPRRTLGGSPKAAQGAAFYTAENPAFGAVFTYYLADDLKTRQEQRQEREKKAAKEADDTPYPGWEELEREAREPKPAIVFTVRDPSGAVVRHVEGPAKKGFHRVAWDLRHPATAAWSPKPEDDDDEEDDDDGSGYLAAPGWYTVDIARRVDGETTDLGQRQRFEVVPLRRRGLVGATADVHVAFLEELAELERQAGAANASVDEAKRSLDAVLETLTRSRTETPGLEAEARALNDRLADLKLRLQGDRRRARLGDEGPVSISRRLSVAGMGTGWSTYGPTPTHRASVDIARQQLAGVRRELGAILDDELPALRGKLDAAGLPWTPGRGMPSGQ